MDRLGLRPAQQVQVRLRPPPAPPATGQARKLPGSILLIPVKWWQLPGKQLLPDKVHQGGKRRPALPAARRLIQSVPRWRIPSGAQASSPARQGSRLPARYVSPAKLSLRRRAYPRQSGKAPVRPSRKPGRLPLLAGPRGPLPPRPVRQEHRKKRLRLQYSESSPSRPGRNAADLPRPPPLRRLPPILVNAPTRQEPRRTAPLRLRRAERPEIRRSGRKGRRA